MSIQLCVRKCKALLKCSESISHALASFTYWDFPSTTFSTLWMVDSRHTSVPPVMGTTRPPVVLSRAGMT